MIEIDIKQVDMVLTTETTLPPMYISLQIHNDNNKCFIDNREVITILCVIQIITRLGLTQIIEPARENKTFPTCGALNGPSSWNDHTHLRISMQCRIS